MVYISDVGVVWFVAENYIRSIEIVVLSKAGTNEQLCARERRKFKPHEKRTISCASPLLGSIVRIRNMGRSFRSLKLCGVKVFGTVGNAAVILE